MLESRDCQSGFDTPVSAESGDEDLAQTIPDVCAGARPVAPEIAQI
jgi:hypothetical protein